MSLRLSVSESPRFHSIRPTDCRSNAGGSPCVIEPLESRQFFSASLQVQNLDIIPGYERLIFSKVGQLDPNIPNKFKDTGKLRLLNTGDTALQISGAAFSGPFKVIGALPSSIAPGKSADITIQFTATAPPAFTYNQTNGFNEQTRAGTYIGSFSFKTNDPQHATWKEELAGWYQTRSEHNQEPSLQVMINLIMNYKTNIAPPKTVQLTQGSTPKYYGEEVVSAYWQRVDASKNVGVRQIAAYHTQGTDVPVFWFSKAAKTQHQILRHDGKWSQSFLPPSLGGSGSAFGSFSTSEVFGFKIDTEWSDDKLNKLQQYGGGHHVRFYPARDHFGNLIANTYFLVGDYSNIVASTGPNNDFQDNVYIISNIKPVGGQSADFAPAHVSAAAFDRFAAGLHRTGNAVDHRGRHRHEAGDVHRHIEQCLQQLRQRQLHDGQRRRRQG